MNTAILIALGVAGVVLLLWKVAGVSVDRDIDRAVKDGDMDGLLQALTSRPEGEQPTAFNRAIKRLWDDYQREEAVPLIRELTERHEDASISQFWLDTLRSVEPELASRLLEPGFMDKHFKANIAAKCGNAG